MLSADKVCKFCDFKDKSQTTTIQLQQYTGQCQFIPLRADHRTLSQTGRKASSNARWLQPADLFLLRKCVVQSKECHPIECCIWRRLICAMHTRSRFVQRVRTEMCGIQSTHLLAVSVCSTKEQLKKISSLPASSRECVLTGSAIPSIIFIRNIVCWVNCRISGGEWIPR